MNHEKPILRAAERDAFCRACDKMIKKGENMVSFYSFRNRGMWVHICTSCVEDIGDLIIPTKHPNIQSAAKDGYHFKVMFPDGSWKSYQEEK